MDKIQRVYPSYVNKHLKDYKMKPARAALAPPARRSTAMIPTSVPAIPATPSWAVRTTPYPMERPVPMQSSGH